MTKIIAVKAHTRTVKDIPDPFSASFPATREHIAKTRDDIRRSMQSSVPVINAVAEDEVQERFIDCIMRLVRGNR